jgi:hypothetical protein
MKAEMHALGKSLDGEAPLVYRVRKTAFIKGFSHRSSAICEDSGLNFGLLLAMLGVGLVSFTVAFFVTDTLVLAFQSAVFGSFLAPPLAMCGVHIYTIYRVDAVAGDASAVVGEATIREAVGVEAIAFEDIEAAPSAGVILSGIRVHCDDPTTVFRYLTALYAHIGGPLCGRFSGMYVNQKGAASSLVELVGATKDGISAAVDGAEVVVGNGHYMMANGISPAYDATDERVLPDGRSGVLYVAVNGMICMKFYMEHRISAAFEKNVMRLHKLGIAAILRTYDPNFTDKTIARASSLHDCRVHVVSKRVDQLNDFYAQSADGGLVTSESSGMLLRLLLLCFRAKRVLRFGWIYKLVGCVLGGVMGVSLATLGAYAFVPSVSVVLYQLILLGAFLFFAWIRIKLPDISEGK